MTYVEMNSFILDYLKNDITGRAIMLTGEWGCGKTYLIQKELEFEKEALVLFLEQNKELKLSHLFSLYEYFESLIFPEFIYHINNGYLAQIPLYLSKKYYIYLIKRN